MTQDQYPDTRGAALSNDKILGTSKIVQDIIYAPLTRSVEGFSIDVLSCTIPG